MYRISYTKFISAAAVAIILMCLVFCSQTDSTAMKTSDAWVLIIISSLYKKQECRSFPEYILPVNNKPDRVKINACSMAIIESSCPFNGYPDICYTMYVPEK